MWISIFFKNETNFSHIMDDKNDKNTQNTWKWKGSSASTKEGNNSEPWLDGEFLCPGLESAYFN
jgi:hypothetical protein